MYSYQLYEQPVDELAGWFLEIADMCGCDIMLCKESHDSNPEGVPDSFYYSVRSTTLTQATLSLLEMSSITK